MPVSYALSLFSILLLFLTEKPHENSLLPVNLSEVRLIFVWSCGLFYINISDFFFSSLAPLTIIITPVTIPVVSTMIPTARLHAPVEDMVLYIFSFIVILTFMLLFHLFFR